MQKTYSNPYTSIADRLAFAFGFALCSKRVHLALRIAQRLDRLEPSIGWKMVALNLTREINVSRLWAADYAAG